MDLAAVVMVPNTLDFDAVCTSQPHLTMMPRIGEAPISSVLPILGNDVLQTWTKLIRRLGVRDMWLTSGEHGNHPAGPALVELAKQGIKRLLMIKLKSYAEVDLADLLRFHSQKRSSLTEVFDTQGQLGISVLDQIALLAGDRKSKPHGDGKGTAYPFRGYAKRILSARERQELIGDALTGACAMRPLGTQITERVWVGKDARIAESAKVIGPTYIGDRTIVCAGASIGPVASIERDCVVDFGTTVEGSTVLPFTFLGAGLLIRQAVVDGGRLEDLESSTVADLRPGGLADRIHGRRPGSQAFRETATGLSSKGCWHVRNATASASSAGWQQVQL